MTAMKICQSCSMPLDNPALTGTEKDGSTSTEYCTYCYRDGEFINPGLTLEQMQVIVREQMEKRHLGQPLIDNALNSLPGLKRWHHESIGGLQYKK